MTGVSERARRPDDDVPATPAVVELELPADRPFGAICRLVAAGVAGRHAVTVDRIDDLQQALDAALGQPPAAEVLGLRITPTGDDLRYELGPLAVEGARLHAFERVLSTLVEGATTNVTGREAWIDLRIPLPPTERG